MTTYINTANAMITTFRKLECIPELDYYKFGSIVTTNRGEDDDQDYQNLWEEHGLVMMTAEGVSGDASPIQDAVGYSNFCNIEDGWYTTVKTRFTYPSEGSIEEQLQLIYGDKMVLDSINRYGCYAFADTACDNFYFGIQSIEAIGTFLTITAAASHVELGRYYNKVKQESDKPWAEYSEDECKTYYLSVGGWLSHYFRYMRYDSITFPHTDEVITLPLTRDKLKRIMYLEYTSPSPRYKGIHVGNHVYKPDKCYFDITFSFSASK